jgi:hypothetical protein
MNMLKNTSTDTILNTSYTVTLEEDGDECLLPIPEELLNHLDWQDGDMLDWIINPDNTITINKVDQQDIRKQTEDLLDKIDLPTQYTQDFDDLLAKVYLTGYNNGIRHVKQLAPN